THPPFVQIPGKLLGDGARRTRNAREVLTRRELENGVYRLASALVRVVPEVRVGVQRFGCARMPKTFLHDLDGLAMPDEQARVVVPEAVENGGRYARILECASPHSVESRAAQRCAVLIREDQSVWPGREQ